MPNTTVHIHGRVLIKTRFLALYRPPSDSEYSVFSFLLIYILYIGQMEVLSSLAVLLILSFFLKFVCVALFVCEPINDDDDDETKCIFFGSQSGLYRWRPENLAKHSRVPICSTNMIDYRSRT